MDNPDNVKGYKGNVLLKKTNQNIEFSQERVEEYLKCQMDPIYFAETYVKIITLNDGLQNFHPWDYQKNMIESFKDNRYTIVTTAELQKLLQDMKKDNG